MTINWNELYHEQLKLDHRIKKEKDLAYIDEGDLINAKILALSTEVGELANEWRGFKFWSDNRKPKEAVKGICKTCIGRGKVNGKKCDDCDGDDFIIIKDDMLEEYVDVIHFMLSIGNDIGFRDYNHLKPIKPYIDITQTFNMVYSNISLFHMYRFNNCYQHTAYVELFNLILGLGELLDYKGTQIQRAYHTKNKKNHNRQDTGY